MPQLWVDFCLFACFCFCFSVMLGYSDSFLVPYKFEVCFSNSLKKHCWYIYRDYIEYLEYFGHIDILTIFFFHSMSMECFSLSICFPQFLS